MRKQTLCFLVIADSFQKINLYLEVKKVITVSILMGTKQHKISEAHTVTKTCNKIVVYSSIIAKADAVGIVAAIEKAFLDETETDMQPNEWCNKTVVMSMDGASAMIGIRNGVVTMIKADIPHLISVHCVGPRLELGIKDRIKEVAYLAKVEEFL